MNVFNLRDQLVTDYSEYVRSYIAIRDERISKHVAQRLDEGMLWPEPLIQLNPSFEPGAWIDELVQEGVLHAECSNIFRKDKTPTSLGDKMRLHRHREEAARVAKLGVNPERSRNSSTDTIAPKPVSTPTPAAQGQGRHPATA